MARELSKFNSDFHEIANLVHAIHNQKSYCVESGHLRRLALDLLEVRAKHQNSFSLTHEDIQQQLALIWIELIRQRKANKPNARIRTWLKRMSCWAIRDWYAEQMRAVSHAPTAPYEYVQNYLGFTLNFNFLRNGTKFHPLSELSPYERYLIFLRFKQDKDILEIANVVQKDRDTVSRHLRKIYGKMRQLKNDNENTRRSREDGPRVSTSGDHREGDHPRDRNPARETD